MLEQRPAERAEAQRRFFLYYTQLHRGCGNAECANAECASGSGIALPPAAAAARAIQACANPARAIQACSFLPQPPPQLQPQLAQLEHCPLTHPDHAVPGLEPHHSGEGAGALDPAPQGHCAMAIAAKST